MSARTRATAPPAGMLDGDALARELEPLLRALSSAHEKWLIALGSHRDAVRHADRDGLTAAIDRERVVLGEIADLEERRRRLVEQAAPSPTRNRSSPITLTELAGRAPAAIRPRLLEEAARLRALIEQVRRETSVIRAATGSLMAHLEGVARRVGRRLSHAGTYGRRGIVEPCSAVATSVDFRL